MPDIAMCFGGDCPQKENCYRFRAFPSEFQSYFLTNPNENDNCCVFLKIEDTQSIKELDDNIY